MLPPADTESSSTAGLKNHHQEKRNHRVLVEGTEFQGVAGLFLNGQTLLIGGGGRGGSAACVETQTQALIEHRAARNQRGHSAPDHQQTVSTTKTPPAISVGEEGRCGVLPPQLQHCCPMASNAPSFLLAKSPLKFL